MSFQEMVQPEIHLENTGPEAADIQSGMSEQERFEKFVDGIQYLEDKCHQFSHNGVADFLTYKLGHLKGSDFEIANKDATGLYREVRDCCYMNPIVCERPCLLYESRLVNDKGKPVTISYKDEDRRPDTPTTESYPFPPHILDRGHPDYFTISKGDLVKAFRSIRREVKKKLVSPITQTTGYKWVYTRSTYKNRVYFLYFSCFQDHKKDMVPSKFKHKSVLPIFEPQDCDSAISIGINIYSKKFVLQYVHKPHTRLLDIMCTLMLEMYDSNAEYRRQQHEEQKQQQLLEGLGGPETLPPLEHRCDGHHHDHGHLHYNHDHQH
ncbi:hypothetical protein BON22_2557 [Cyberlindnera fabianii]|uniref:Uncharacterized protein n=1 Tax=Cyberlindnera fabianii TaxID=36022 RepID=A0A1V2L7I3_CYBFA|nr:hypothetical protein BON22_2557 [Cyberlindnera fabianii]